MKKSIVWVAALALLAGCAEKGPQTISGVVADATMNTVTIINGADTMCFSTTDAAKEMVPSPVECTVTDGLVIGDSVQIVYTGKFLEGKSIQTCAVSKILITPVSIIGSWIEPIPGMEGVQGVTLNADGVAASINMATLVYNSWTLDNGTLYLSGQSLGNGQTINVNDIWTVDTLSPDSLILSAEGRPTMRYARLK